MLSVKKDQYIYMVPNTKEKNCDQNSWLLANLKVWKTFDAVPIKMINRATFFLRGLLLRVFVAKQGARYWFKSRLMETLK